MICVLSIALTLCLTGQAALTRYDVLVYGSTPGGIQAALSASSEGASVALVSPTARLGGMMTSGLGHTDKGRVEAIGGAAMKFFRDVCPAGARPPCWDFPPSHGLALFERMLAADPNITVLYQYSIAAVTRDGTAVTSVALQPSSPPYLSPSPRVQGHPLAPLVIFADYFIDSSYEGDLIAAAAISTTIGREAQSQYNESHAGVQYEPSSYGSHQFPSGIDPFWPNGSLLPLISNSTVAPVGSGDNKVQAYNFRLCMTQNTSNMLPFAAPLHYDASTWELARRYILAGNVTSMNDLMIMSAVGEGKTDTNNKGPVSTDCIGCSDEWPAASESRRRELWQLHKDYTLGLMWFLQHDEALPEQLREEVQTWGLAADEFQESGGWPPQLYVREGRRMVGTYVFTQNDRQFNLSKPDSIGLFSYNIDSHHVQRVVGGDGPLKGSAMNEGDFELYGGTIGQIPYRIMLPLRSQATNVLAGVALSATHMGYGTLRLEPQLMIIGQSAGVAVAQALRNNKQALQDVDVAALQRRLRQLGQLIDFMDT